MKTRAACLFIGGVLMTGCSDVTAPAPATFQARLSGARVATLSGSSNAGPIFTERFGLQFAIRMFAPQGDTLRAISIACPGQEPPVPGTYALNQSESDCTGGYGRLISTLGGTIILEQLAATSGSVTISPSSGDQTVGTFTFNGIFVLGSDSVGTVTASGAFSAEVL